MPYALVDDQRLFYARSRAKTPDAPTLVLIHGAGGSHLHWPPGLRRLPQATVYALDLPGHGRSEGPGRDKIGAYAEALIGFLDAIETEIEIEIEAEQVLLMGHSMGGAIAQRTALEHPGRVTGLVLIGTGGRLRVAPAILEGSLKDFETTVDLITRWAWAEEAPESLTRRGRQTLAETPPQVLHDDFAACDAFDVMDRLEQIEAPTLVIAGTADRLTPHKYGLYLAEKIPHARLVTVEGGGHMMALEQPEVVVEAVAAFVENL